MVLPAYKRRVTIVVDKHSYLDRCQELWNDRKTYQKFKRDPTSIYQEKFKEALWDIKVCVVITDKMHGDLFPATEHPPRFYRFPKVHKATIPL